MENFLLIISAVLLLMCLTALKAIWKLNYRVETLEKEAKAIRSK